MCIRDRLWFIRTIINVPYISKNGKLWLATHVLHKLVIIALTVFMSMVFCSLSDLSWKRLLSNPSLHTSVSGTCWTSKHFFKLKDANSWGFLNPVCLVSNLRFRHVEDLGSVDTILARPLISLLGDWSNFRKKPAYWQKTLFRKVTNHFNCFQYLQGLGKP